MGRKTYESIGKALPFRKNFIITRNPSYQAENCIIVSSLEDAIQEAKKDDVEGNEEIFIMGGAQIYEQGINLSDKLYLTLVNDKYDADAYFPEYINFTETKREEHNNGQFSFAFLELEKK